MKKLNFLMGAMALIFTANIAVKAAPQADSITITVYLDCRDWKDIKAVAGAADSAANAHNATQYASYDPSVMYITGHWSPPTEPGKGDWTFIKMESIATDIFKVTFKYGVGQFAGNTTDDPDLLTDNPGWYFAPTNDWSTQEYVPAPCNVAWDVQRIFKINVNKPDTTVVFKYGVCEPQTLCSLDIASLCVANSVNNTTNSNGVSIFPNPANDNILVKSANAISSLIIYDVTGKQVEKIKLNGASEASINISNLSSQLYFVQFNHTNGSLSTSKLFKR
jgi:hypothetical protein